MRALDHLAALAARAGAPGALLDIAGTVTAVAPTSYKVRGLSPFSQLGDCVSLRERPNGERVRHGEIVHVEAGHVTVKPYATTGDVALGDRATWTERVSLAPAPS